MAPQKKNNHAGKSSRKAVWPWILVVSLLAAGLIGSFVFMKYQEHQSQMKLELEQQMAQTLDVDTFYPGVFVDEIDLGGMTMAEAQAKVQEKIDAGLESVQVTVTLEENSKTFTAQDMEVDSDLEQVLAEAMQVGREGEREERYAYVQSLAENPVKLTTTVDVKADPLETKVRELAESWKIEAVEPAVSGFDPNAETKFTVTQPVAGRAVKADELWTLVKAEVDNKTYGTVQAPVEALEPTQTVEDVLKMNTLINRFETKMTNDSNRITNIKVACAAIAGTILQPGEEFSFNTVVGPRTAERGYKEAGVIVGGMSDVGLGGGVCQVSGTLYNAVVRADLEIVNRKRHSYALGYLGPGTDATVDYQSGTDFVFKNNQETPVYINMYTDGLKVIAEVYGVPLKDGMTIDLVVDILSKTSPGERVTVEDSSIPVGESKKVSGHTGYKLNAYRVYYDKDGNEIDRVLLHKDNYPVIQPKLLVNPKTNQTTTTTPAKPATTTTAAQTDPPETTTTAAPATDPPETVPAAEGE